MNCTSVASNWAIVSQQFLLYNPSVGSNYELATPYRVEENSAKPLPAISGQHSTTTLTAAKSASVIASSGPGEFSPSNRV